MAVMIPKYIDSMMAKICFTSGKCEDASHKGYYVVNVCDEHFTSPGFVDRIQLNMYFTNSTRCRPLGVLDEFDCEALQFGNDVDDFRRFCVTSHPMLLASVHERNEFWYR
jgi:hypothetical protein